MAEQAGRPQRRVIIGVLLALAGWIWSGGHPPLGAARATAADCVEIGIWSNDWHSSFALPAELLPDDHPLRRLYPEAKHFLVGWGDADFYRSDGTDMALGLKALLPGGKTVVHVIAAPRPVEETFIPAEMVYAGLSHAGAQKLAEELAQTLRLDDTGAAIPVAPGQHGAQSRFLAARGNFDLFTVCNHWTARTLRSAGVDVNGAFTYRGDWLTAQARRSAPRCAALR